MLASCRLALFWRVCRETVARQVLSKHFQHRCKGLEEIQAGLNANNVSKAARVVANVGKLTDLVESHDLCGYMWIHVDTCGYMWIHVDGSRPDQWWWHLGCCIGADDLPAASCVRAPWPRG